MIAGMMTMRVTIERNFAEPGEYGEKGEDWKILYTEIPCNFWEGEDRKNYQTHIVESGVPTMVLHKGTDVTIDDRIINVIDRRGRELSGKMTIESVVSRIDHVELKVKKIA